MLTPKVRLLESASDKLQLASEPNPWDLSCVLHIIFFVVDGALLARSSTVFESSVIDRELLKLITGNVWKEGAADGRTVGEAFGARVSPALTVGSSVGEIVESIAKGSKEGSSVGTWVGT